VARYPLNLPETLKRDAQELADREGVSLNQLILWALADKVASLRDALDDPRFPQVTYRPGGSGRPVPVLRGSGVRVVTLYTASERWGLSLREVAEQYSLPDGQAKAALAFAAAHRAEMEAEIAADEALAEAM
jgi:uncharacterized protein (DUF433 family)